MAVGEEKDFVGERGDIDETEVGGDERSADESESWECADGDVGGGVERKISSDVKESLRYRGSLPESKETNDECWLCFASMASNVGKTSPWCWLRVKRESDNRGRDKGDGGNTGEMGDEFKEEYIVSVPVGW